MDVEVFGVPSSYLKPESGSRGERRLPKAEIRIDIPRNDDGPDTLARLRADHDDARYQLPWNEYVAPYVDPHNDRILRLRHFVLGDVGESVRSRFQVVESNESPILFMFGEQARIYNYNFHILSGGTNLRNQDTDWKRLFERFYDRFNGAVIAHYRLKMYLSFAREEHQVVWLNLDMRRSSETDVLAVAQSQMFLVKKRWKQHTVNGA